MANGRKGKKPQLPRKRRTGPKAFRAIQQGVGRSVPRAFGAGKKGDVFDATSPAHLPLPIATGPYTTMRVTRIIDTDRSIMFGTFRASATSLVDRGTANANTIVREGWAPYCAVGATSNGANTPAFASVFYKMGSLDQLGPQAQVVPSAMTVQVMNPNALQTTNGILYVGRMKTQFRGEDATETWENLFQEFVAYQAPRLCSAGKLALRGVKVNAVPFNLRELQDFDRILDPYDTNDPLVAAPWSSVGEGVGSVSVNPRLNMKGFAPIAVYNPDQVRLQYLVTMEFRCRFDLGHPASSTHVHHNPSSDATWSQHIKNMLDMGHGAVDIADTIAAGYQAYRNLQPMMAAIAG